MDKLLTEEMEEIGVSMETTLESAQELLSQDVSAQTVVLSTITKGTQCVPPKMKGIYIKMKGMYIYIYIPFIFGGTHYPRAQAQVYSLYTDE